MRNIFQPKRDKSKIEENIKAQILQNKDKQIQFYNFWEQSYETMFWYRFLQARPHLLNNKLRYGFYSVFGDRSIIHKTTTDINIFYSAENVKNRFNYADHFLTENQIHLAMGFEYFEHERYIRFPNWMDVFFLKNEDIMTICNQLRFPNIENKQKFASCICSHDNIKGADGLRTSIIDALSEIDVVSCPGKFRHNDDSLVNAFNDNKLEYLKQFQFNICPENSNAMGYVTEKIFHAISAGCIPIYWGSYNRPELDVLNQDAIIFWNKDGDNTNAIKLIKELVTYPKLMNSFLEQPRLLPDAGEYIANRFEKVEKLFNDLVSL